MIYIKKPRYKKRSAKKNKLKFKILFILIFFVLVTILGVRLLNNRLFPIVEQMAHIDAISEINRMINECINSLTKELELKSSDFYIKTEGSDGKINSLSANTLLINDFCAKIAVELSTELSNGKLEMISVPAGALLGIDLFANFGPKYTFKVLPKGNATVDYETEFKSEGINQINFQIWLNVESKIQLVNPLQHGDVTVKRKITLVNTIITGEVPPAYINTK